MLKVTWTSARAILNLSRPALRQYRRYQFVEPPARKLLSRKWDEGSSRLFASTSQCKQEPTTAVESGTVAQHVAEVPLEARERAKKLPIACPGCGALSQTIDPDAAGFYGSKRAVKATHKSASRQEEDEIFANALQAGSVPRELAPSSSGILEWAKSPDVPICERCHNLRYQSKGASIIHPSMQSIQQIIEESPHKHNHIYHILDAADFPLSLIPNLVSALHLPRLRTQNRRSKSMHYIRGRVAEVSFIITRSDLLAPKKEQVDSLVPYLRDVLRDSLGRSGRNIRLGNVRCVSAKRGWWTKTVKEDIWDRGGAGWMVGKVNVGKSALYEVVFPKGRNQEEVDVNRIRRQEERQALESGFARLESNNAEGNTNMQQAIAEQTTAFAISPGELSETKEAEQIPPSTFEPFQESEIELEGRRDDLEDEDVFFDEREDGSLLPPAQLETAYPDMPLVSALPGTTASPIRIPFGNGKGELIDLPGVHRSSLDTYVKSEHRKELVMTSRVVPEQHTIKSGQSILLGGMIRITPKNDDLVFLAYPFVPLTPHVTSNEKATAIQTGVQSDGEPYSGTVDSIATNEAKANIKHAGTFQLQWDVTKQRAGPLTDRAAGKQKAANLPFIVYSADILIEGVGWVELTCQVRSRQKSFITESFSDALGEGTVRKQVPLVPEVEVWSPEGKFVSIRPPMNAWLLGGPKKVPMHARRSRPRQSINFAKRKAGGAAGSKKLVAE